MFKLSKLTDYAVVVLAYLADDKMETPQSSAMIAKATSLPEPTVSKVLKLLAKSGLIESTRGTKGGYSILKPADSISISDIITAIEGPISLTSCVKEAEESCVIEQYCQLYGRWTPVNTALKQALGTVSLADMIGNTMPRTLDMSSGEARL